MSEKLTADELVALVRRVFTPKEDDRRMAILVDMPDAEVPDTDAWRERREMALDWHEKLAPRAAELGLEELRLLCYRNPRGNNADLPATGVFHGGGPLPATADELAGDAVPLDQIGRAHV